MKTLLARCVFVLSFLCSSIVFSQGYNASFDCKLASAEIEKIICADKELSQLDATLAKKYQDFLNKLPDTHKTTARNIQRKWLRQRLDNCNPNYYAYCVSTKYQQWLNDINGGVLHIVEMLDQNPVKDPQNAAIDWRVMHIYDANSTAKDAMTYRVIMSKEDGVKLVGDGVHREYVWDYPVAIHFFLTQSGDFYRAYQRDAGSDKRLCSRKTRSTLHFLSDDDSFEDIGNATILEGSFECDGAVSNVHRIVDRGDGRLSIFFKEKRDFYHHYLFSSMKLWTVDLTQRKVSSSEYLDTSTTTFVGTPYQHIFQEFITEEERVDDQEMKSNSTECPLTGYEAFTYIGLKVHLESHGIGFRQVQFISEHVLSASDVKSLSRYKPLLSQALLYLDKAREHPHWETKLAEAARAFPNIIFKEGYEYEFAFPHDKEPFTDAGFYSDEQCYAKAISPMAGASFEEWIYLFWNRRLTDGTLESTEKILRSAHALL
jgi:uncharacterized protein